MGETLRPRYARFQVRLLPSPHTQKATRGGGGTRTQQQAAGGGGSAGEARVSAQQRRLHHGHHADHPATGRCRDRFPQVLFFSIADSQHLRCARHALHHRVVETHRKALGRRGVRAVGAETGVHREVQERGQVGGRARVRVAGKRQGGKDRGPEHPIVEGAEEEGVRGRQVSEII